MSERQRFGFSDEELASKPSVYRDDLFAGQAAIVSGGGSGIGRATAWLLARLGAKVMICGRTPEKLDGVVAAAAERGFDISAKPTDIRNPAQVDALVAEAWDRFGRLDLLVNNAGGQFPQPAIDISVKGWNSVIETNLSGTWFMMQAAAQRWRDAEASGNIVHVITVIERGMPGVAHTIAARAGVVGLMNTVAIEWAEYGIRVNCVAPGPIGTEGLDVYPPEAVRVFDRSNPMLRVGDAWDVAEAIVYLGGPSGKFITGEVLTVDGGHRLWGELFTAGKPKYFRDG
jgi:citronellol/citronellal dehydrogenase